MSRTTKQKNTQYFVFTTFYTATQSVLFILSYLLAALARLQEVRRVVQSIRLPAVDRGTSALTKRYAVDDGAGHYHS